MPPAYHTKLYKNINQISPANLVSGYTQTIGNGIYGYTLVNTSAGNISNVNISITSTWPNGSIWLYNFDKSGNMSPKYDTLATPTTITYNYTPFPTASSTLNIIPPGGYFVIDVSLLSANSTVTFTINSITFS